VFVRVGGIFDLPPVALSSVSNLIDVDKESVLHTGEKRPSLLAHVELVLVDVEPYLVNDFKVLVVPFFFLFAGLDTSTSVLSSC